MRIPSHMQNAIDAWVNRGVPHPEEMGSFLRCVLLHNLWEAAVRADTENAAALRDWVLYVSNEIPSNAHGSMANLIAWHEQGGLVGGGLGVRRTG
jgi:hypothetical protein